MPTALLTPEQTRLVAAEYYQIPALRAPGVVNLMSFHQMVYDNLLLDAPQWIYVPAYPKYLVPGTPEYQAWAQPADPNNPTASFAPTITWSVKRMEPAAIGGNGEPFGTGTRHLTPRPLGKEQNPADPNLQRTIYVQRYDIFVSYNVWCTTNFEAESGVEWFRQWLMTKRKSFMAQGLENVLFWGRSNDVEERPRNNGLEVRPLTFFLRTQELTTEDVAILKNLQFSITLA